MWCMFLEDSKNTAVYYLDDLSMEVWAIPLTIEKIRQCLTDAMVMIHGLWCEEYIWSHNDFKVIRYKFVTWNLSLTGDGFDLTDWVEKPGMINNDNMMEWILAQN